MNAGLNSQALLLDEMGDQSGMSNMKSIVKYTKF
jgi:hypothetical protein